MLSCAVVRYYRKNGDSHLTDDVNDSVAKLIVREFGRTGWLLQMPTPAMTESVLNYLMPAIELLVVSMQVA